MSIDVAILHHIFGDFVPVYDMVLPDAPPDVWSGAVACQAKSHMNSPFAHLIIFFSANTQIIQYLNW